MRSFGKILSRLRTGVQDLDAQDLDTPGPLPRPAPPVCVIGDLHGRLDLLDIMLDGIAAHAEDPTHRIIFAGDMIDRGPHSADILCRLSAMTAAAPERIICLMGNHERMMLDFLDDPIQHGPRWLANGGTETLASFGLSPWSRKDSGGATPQLRQLADSLSTAMGDDLLRWLRALPLWWRDGNLAVTHAGADPAIAIEDQAEQSLLWGHPAFARRPRSDGIWIAHGHTVMPAPITEAGRIAVDTGAWRTHRLSAAWLDAGGLTFFEASPDTGQRSQP